MASKRNRANEALISRAVTRGRLASLIATNVPSLRDAALPLPYPTYPIEPGSELAGVARYLAEGKLDEEMPYSERTMKRHFAQLNEAFLLRERTGITYPLSLRMVLTRCVYASNVALPDVTDEEKEVKTPRLTARRRLNVGLLAHGLTTDEIQEAVGQGHEDLVKGFSETVQDFGASVSPPIRGRGRWLVGRAFDLGVLRSPDPEDPNDLPDRLMPVEHVIEGVRALTMMRTLEPPSIEPPFPGAVTVAHT